jgi:SAM-dependent methyltransferase
VTLVRVGPVHFQSLEQELEPVAGYLTGHMLNAGCGSRDITAYLRGKGVSEITRYDIASQEDDVVIGPLEAMPFGDGSFDSALCNAVLEHVGDAERAVHEISRVVRDGGHIVLAVPFLQPYHACPGDFQRYTADGLTQLGRRAGLEVVEILPVHSLAQTLGWILWEHAQESGGVLRKGFAWTFAFVATRLCHRTNRAVVKNANTYQAVFRRPHPRDAVSGGAWRDDPVPAACGRIPTMLVPDELRLLHWLARDYYRGLGAIVDGGAFLGGSTVALADGLRHNRRRRHVAATPIHSFDRFEVEDWTRGPFFPESTPAGASFRTRFEDNIAPYADLIEVHAGDVRDHQWTAGPIEILFIDMAKHWTVCDWVTWQFFPHLIPGRSLVIQQDYLYHHWVGWLHVTMEFYADYFEYLCDTGVNSVVFLNTRKIPAAVLRPDTVGSLTTEEKATLMDRAANRFAGPQRDMVLAAKAHFLEQLKAS